MVQDLTSETFVEKISEVDSGEFNFKGDKPAVIDFWAPWCGPCKMVGPVMEELSDEYEGKVDIYKINTDEQQDLAMKFGIQSIPSILFIPTEGQPQMSIGALPKEALAGAFKDILGVE